MKITKNTVVELSYDLRLNNFEDKIIESATIETPLTFIYGIGAMLPKFEENIENMQQGDKFKFVLSPQEGYGLQLDENFVDVPKNIFQENGQDSPLLFEGNTISLQDNQGNVYDAKVHKINSETVTMDFNHPLAGQSLYFEGEVLSIREATKEELEHKHAHSSHCNHCDGHDEE